MTTDTPAKPKSKTAAMEMYAEDRREWEESYFAEAEAYVNNLTQVLAGVNAGDDEQAKHLMAAVALHVPREPGLGDMRCITCMDEDSWGAAQQWPCPSFTHLAQGLNLDGLAEKGEGPVPEDYWKDPWITVTLGRSARVTAAGSRVAQFLHRGAQVTLTLAEAQRVKSQLMPSSQQRVETLS